MALENLQDLMVDNLKDLYNAEKQILAALPSMAKKAKTPELRQALESHRQETQEHVHRLEQAFEILDVPPRGKTCRGMEGIIKEGKEILEEEAEDAVRDAGIIVAAQKVEHYEIGMYGTLITYAELLGLTEVAELLGNTLDEEKAADEKLTEIAESDVNNRAMEGGDEMEDEEEEEEEVAPSKKRSR